MTKRIAICTRVSPEKQTADDRLIELRSLFERPSRTIFQEYTGSGGKELRVHYFFFRGIYN